ncbi:MAG: glycosyltransferase, partial [Gemmataceae bacterium]|nr:glycosyltransferase [Gemmataceae bacterium]
MKKILHLTAGNLYGGIETFLVTLARLRDLCPEMEPHYGLCFPGRLRDELLAAGVPVYELGMVRLSRPWTVWRARWQLKQLLRQESFAAVVTHGSWPHVVFGPVVQRAGLRLVYMAHDAVSRRHWLNRWAARTLPHTVIANSRFTSLSINAVFPGARTETIYLPVPPPVLDDNEAVRDSIRKALGTRRDQVVILQVGRLERLKGHIVHIEALGRLRELPVWEAWFVGGPQKKGEAEFLAELQQ